MARIEEGQQPYSNMTARKVVLFAGFFTVLDGFLCALFATLILFFPDMNVITSVLPIELIKILYILALVLDFVGCVLCVAGANTAKGLARLSFFLAVVSFIVSAGFMVVLLFFDTLIPFGALSKLKS